MLRHARTRAPVLAVAVSAAGLLAAAGAADAARSSGGATVPNAASRSAATTVAPARDVAPKDKFFLAGRRLPAYALPAGTAGPVAVQLERVDDGAVVRTWQVDDPAAKPKVRWNGMIAGKAAPSARYRFSLAPAGTTATGPAAQASNATARASAGEAFAFYDRLFPIRGRHDLGRSATNGFGGGRGHQGHDLFAKCGTRLAAAQGGRVRFAGYHPRSGNYVIVSGRDGFDYGYMHLQSPALVRTGQKVFTGQLIGAVGDTGNANGCHLHFELWTAPGWYRGGKPIDPLPLLRSWDSYS